MLKQRVVIAENAGNYSGKEGIVVVIRHAHSEESYRGKVTCKVLINNMLSSWIPYEWLKFERGAFSTNS